jgi:hypothetical protein
MLTLFGISNFKAIELGDINNLSSHFGNYEYFIQRLYCEPINANPFYQYSISDSKNSSCEIKNNGWTLGNFTSCEAFGQKAIHFVPLDPKGNSHHNVTFQINPHHSHVSLKIELVIGVDAVAINSVLDEFIRASQFPNWLEYLKTRHEISLDEKYYKVPVIESNDNDLIKSLQDEVKKLRLENKELTSKLKKMKFDISKRKK